MCIIFWLVRLLYLSFHYDPSRLFRRVILHCTFSALLFILLWTDAKLCTLFGVCIRVIPLSPSLTLVRLLSHAEINFWFTGKLLNGKSKHEMYLVDLHVCLMHSGESLMINNLPGHIEQTSDAVFSYISLLFFRLHHFCFSFLTYFSTWMWW